MEVMNWRCFSSADLTYRRRVRIFHMLRDTTKPEDFDSVLMRGEDRAPDRAG
jgi:hypothetical protein